MTEYECKKCGNDCVIDGEFPRYLAWCDECDDYAEGFDSSDYARYVAAFIADGHDRIGGKE